MAKEEDFQFYKKAYEREVKRRKEAEEQADNKSAQLFTAKEQLKKLTDKFEKEVVERTQEISVLARLPQELPDPFMRISREGTIAFMNQACIECWQPHLNLDIGFSYPLIFEKHIHQAIINDKTDAQIIIIGDDYWRVQFTAVEAYGYINVLGHNITAQQKAESELRNSRLDLVEAQKLAGLGHWELDLKNSKLSWSENLHEQYALEDSNDIPSFDQIFKNVAPSDAEKVKAEVEKAVNTGYSQFEFKIIRPDGSEKILQTTISLDKDNAGKAIRLYGTSFDITNLRSTQEQLEESEERFDLAIQGMNDGIWDYHPQREEVYISPQFKSQLGYSENELESTYKSLVQYIHPEDFEVVSRQVNASHPNKKLTIRSQVRLMHRSGEYRYFMVRAIVLKNDAGEVQRIVGSNTDITERINNEKQLQKNLEQLQMLSSISLLFNQSLENLDEQLDLSIALIGQHLSADHSYIIETSAEGILASNNFEWYNDSPENEQLQVNYADALPFEKELKQGDLIVADTNSLAKPLQNLLQKQNIKALLAFPFSTGGLVSGIVGVDMRQTRHWTEQDIELLKTYANLLGSVFERAHTEIRLIQSEEKYRSLVENLSEVIFQTDLSYAIEYLNPAWENITEYTPEESSGQNFLNFIVEEYHDEFERFISLLINDHIDFSRLVVRVQTKSGGERHVEILARLKVNNYGNVVGLTGTLADVTEREITRNQLIRAKEEAEAASEAKAKFLSVISHEIRTPLNALLGISNLLLRQNPRFDQEENLKLLKLSGQNLLLLINDILDFNKIEAGKVLLNRQPFNLKNLCEDLVRALQLQANDKELKIDFTYQNSLPAIVVGDATRITQILTNLLDNAIKYTPEGKVGLYIEHEGKIGNIHRVRFNITDTGIGISQEEKASIFKEFTQAKVQIAKPFSGAGLGLTIVERLLELHGSHIELESEVGKGSSFSFIIPFESITKSNYNADLKEIAEPSTEYNGSNLLLVEDNPLNTLVLVQFLEGWGLKPALAESGKEALKLLRAKPFDLVLMDLQMPEMDGFETTKEIRTTLGLKDLPIIALTANALPGIRQKVLAAGMTDYISKPFEPEALFQKLKRYLKVHTYTYTLPQTAQSTANKNQSSLAFYSLDKLLAEGGGNPAFLQKMVRLFISNAETMLPKLKQAVVNQDAETIKLVAHKLKPSITWLDISLAKPLIKTIELLPDNYKAEEYEGVALELHKIIDDSAHRLIAWLEKETQAHI